MDRTETQALGQDAFAQNWPYVPVMDVDAYRPTDYAAGILLIDPSQ